MRPVLHALAVVVSLALCAGCTADGASGERRGRVQAEAIVSEQAEELAGDLRGVAWLENAIYLEARVPLESRDENGGTEITRQLLQSASAFDENGVRVFQLTARIRARVNPGDIGDWYSAGEATVSHCFVYEVRRGSDVAPEHAACPDGPVLQVDTSIVPPQQPQVQPADEEALREFLRQGSVAADVALLQARLGVGLTATALDEDGVTAVAVTARPDGVACVLGRRGPEGGIDVWHPDRTQTMPGEMGCVPELVLYPPL